MRAERRADPARIERESIRIESRCRLAVPAAYWMPMLRTLLLTGILTLPVVANAQVAPCDRAPCAPVAAPRAPSIDPKFELLEYALTTRGADHPMFGPNGAGDIDTTRVAATLRFSRALTIQEVASWESRGLKWLRNDVGHIVSAANVYAAVVPFDLVESLVELPLVRAEVAWQPRILRPLEVTTAQLGANAARLRPDGPDGAGQLVVDIDSMIDVLHPHFFRADGERFHWLDQNESGSFDPGIDGIDLDRDGRLDSRERLFVLDATVVDIANSDLSNDDDTLQASRDWLFADLNGDGVRNAGVDAGFTEEDPAYGEPLFVVEDVDRDDVLEPGEVLVMLGTSKIVEVVSRDRTWRRGRDLIEAASSSGEDSAFHATAVASILLGGQAGYHERIGIAPGSEIIVHSARDDAAATLEDVPQLRAIEAASRLRADVVLHEWTNPYTAQHDGSTNLNVAMDAAWDAGIVQVTPVGNLNLSGKHIQAAAGPDRSTTLEFDVPSGGFAQPDGSALPYSVVYLSLFFRNNVAPLVELETPGGQRRQLGLGDPVVIDGSVLALTTAETSDRGTTQIFVVLYNDESDQPLPDGTWTVTISELQDEDVVWGRVADFYSGWGIGVAWTSPTVGEGTIVYPATADSSFGVGAHTGIVANVGEIGDLRDYSGRGPRIDGALGVDLAAPDDPLAALPGTQPWLDRGYGTGWFSRFGGTSGAAPHVAGAVALLREQNPESSSATIEETLRASADAENLVPAPTVLPNDEWGAGRLDVYAALYGEPAPSNQRPEARATLTDAGIDASASTDPDGDDIEFRFDIDHDGTWETDWTDEPTFDRRPAPTEWARVEVRDAHGFRHGVLIYSRALSSETDAGGGTPSPADESQPRGCCSTARQRSNSPVGLLLALLGLLAAGRVSARSRWDRAQPR
jgi:subtilisin family serine protease